MLIKGITHYRVKINLKEGFDMSGILAVVDCCFGPGDDNVIRIPYVHLADTPSPALKLPTYTVRRGDKEIELPNFNGSIASDLSHAAATALSKVTSCYGKKIWGRTFRVDEAGVREEEEQ